MRAVMVEADTRPVLRVSLRYRGTLTPVNLTDATATLRFRVDDGATYERVMTVMGSVADGRVLYVFQAGEITPGLLHYEVLVIFADGGRLTTTDIKTLTVRSRV